jgi:hypothetical protein
MRSKPKLVTGLRRAALAVSLGALALVGTSVLAAADSGPSQHAKGQFDASTNSYSVVADDDLSAIGARFGTTVGDLEKLNKLTADQIEVGQKIKIAAQAGTVAESDGKKPNIMFIMADDIGIMNVGAYHRGLMVGETPNIDRIANEAACSWTITLCRAAPRVGPPSSPGCIRSA